MAASAARIVLLLDSSKFGVRSLLPVVPLSAIHEIVTDEQIPEDVQNKLNELGIKLHVVSLANAH
jgi:DeoR/GlpR family transcriptional regulator of sugar metabolism